MSILVILVAATLGIQIAFLITFLVGIGKETKTVRSVTSSQGISVIVCAHDEEENLRALIPLLLNQSYPNYEVIIVDDRSNDNTFDFLLEMTAAHPRLRMVNVRQSPTHMNGKKFALTLGIKAAKNEWVLLTDADCRPEQNWVSGMSEFMTDDKEIVLGFSPYKKQNGFLNAFIRFESFVTAIQYAGFALVGLPYMGVGRNLSYRRNLFLKSNGFKEHMDIIGGDDDLFVNQHANSKNTTVASGPAVRVMSIPKTTWKQYFYQKFRHLSVGKKYRTRDKLLLGIFSLTWMMAVASWFLLPLTGQDVYWLLGLAVARVLLLILLFRAATRRFGEPFETWAVPFLDFIYAFYYLVAGPVALVIKRVRWKI